MQTKLHRIAVFFITLMVSPPAFAAEGEMEESPWAFTFSVINFTILLVILYFLLKKPVTDFFRKRSTNTKLEMDKAKKYYDDASQKYQDIAAKLQNADSEAKKLLESLRRDGETEKQQIISHAKELALKINLDSERIIQQEVKRAKEVLRAETVNLAAELASKTLESNLTVADQTNLGNEFIDEVQKMKVH